MKKLIVILFLFNTAYAQKLILGINKATSGCAGVSGISFCNKTAVFMGNSITYGVAASSNANRWTTLFCTAKNATEDNRGVSSITMQLSNPCGGGSFDQTTIPVYNSAVHSALFIALGINDVGYNIAFFTPSQFKIDYTTVITYATGTRGWPAGKIILLNTYQPFSYTTYVGSCTVSVAATSVRAGLYNDKVSEVASENGCILVNIYGAMAGLNSSYFNVDELHPNNSGHAFIANYLINNL